MIISVENLYSRVLSAAPEELAWLDGLLSWAERRRQGARRVRLLGMDRRFPAGLASMVLRRARKDGIEAEFRDLRVRTCEPDRGVDVGWLRPHQVEQLEAAWRNTRGIIDAETGTGKAEVAVAIMATIPCRWLFLVNSSDLARDVASRFQKRTRESAGFVGDGQWTEARVTCATFQTLHARAATEQCRRLLKGAEGLCIDEVHNVAGPRDYRIAMRTPGAYWRIGLSATPLDRSDRRALPVVGVTGSVIHRLGAAEAAARGLVSRPRVTMVRVVQGTPAMVTTYAEAYEACVVGSLQRNAALVGIMRRARRPMLVSCEALPHAEHLAAEARRAGLRAAHVDGSSGSDERDRARLGAIRGALDAIVATRIFNQGIDVPNLGAVINAAAGKSVVRTAQRRGRGSRVMHDEEGNVTKNDFEMWDILDDGPRWIGDHALERMRVYRKRGDDVVVEDAAPATLPLFAGTVR